MSKADVLAEGRSQGLEVALKVIEQSEGTDCLAYKALAKEIRFRKSSRTNTTMTQKELSKAAVTIKEYTIQSVIAMSMIILYGQYGCGRVRLKRFLDEFETYTKEMMEDRIDWLTIHDSLKAETGIELVLPEELLESRVRYS